MHFVFFWTKATRILRCIDFERRLSPFSRTGYDGLLYLYLCLWRVCWWIATRYYGFTVTCEGTRSEQFTNVVAHLESRRRNITCVTSAFFGVILRAICCRGQQKLGRDVPRKPMTSAQTPKDAPQLKPYFLPVQTKENKLLAFLPQSSIYARIRNIYKKRCGWINILAKTW